MMPDKLNTVQVFKHGAGNRIHNHPYYPGTLVFFKNSNKFVSIFVNQSTQPIITNIDPKSKDLGNKLFDS